MATDDDDPKAPQFAADHVRLYAEHKALTAKVDKLKEENEQLALQNRHLTRCLNAVHELIERLN